MSNWDFIYKKTGAPVALDNAPTVDGGADDPRAKAGTNCSFTVTDKYGVEQCPQLLIFAVGGTPTLTVHIYTKTTNSWLPLASAVAPTPTVPAKVSVPPDSLVWIQITANGTTTGVYAGLQPIT